MGACGGCLWIKSALLVAFAAGVGFTHSRLDPIASLTPAAPAPAPPPPVAPTPADPAPQPNPAPATTAVPPTPAPAGPAPAITTPAISVPAASGMIDLAAAQALHEGGLAVFIDARNAEQYAAGHIPGALHMPPEAFHGGQIPPAVADGSLPRGPRLVIYCGGGDCDASKLVAIRLQGFGYSDVVVFQPGWTGWTAAALPAATGEAP